MTILILQGIFLLLGLGIIDMKAIIKAKLDARKYDFFSEDIRPILCIIYVY